MTARAHKHYGADAVVKGSVPRPNSDMNITPMIDVLLVLLVIFMAALPLSQKGLDVDLPPETKDSRPTDITHPIVVEYSADKMIAINHQDVQLSELEERLRTIFEDRRDKTMFISGDGALRYADIINVIDAARGAGVVKVGIVTEEMRRGTSARP